MAKHEHPQAPAPIFYPPGHPLNAGARPPTSATSRVEQPAQQASVQTTSAANDLGQVIRSISDLAGELLEEFFNIPGVTDERGMVDPETFDAATRYAFVAAGNALDYAIRLVTEKGRTLRILKLRRELADEMRAAGMTGEPVINGEAYTGESPSPRPPEQVG